MDKKYKMVLVVRTDLMMGKGKMAAQCCHATLGSYKQATSKEIQLWELNGQAKICVKINNEELLIQLAQKAKKKGLNYYIVHDAGKTQIAPNSKTVLSIGPAPNDQIDAITGNLKLL
jgi:peptidyl-tRNA hydrolase